MKTPIPQNMLLDRNGQPVRVKKVPMSTGKRKFKQSTQKLNEMSPFERFQSSNGSRCRHYSH